MKPSWIILAFGVVGCVLLVGMLLILGEPAPPAAQPAANAEATAADAATLAEPLSAASAPQSADSSTTQPAAAHEQEVALPLTANLVLPDGEVALLRRKLKQIALGFLNFVDANKAFPPGRSGTEGQQLSWRVQLLPFLDQEPLYKRFHMNEPWDSPHNKALIDFMPDVYRTGSEEGAQTAFVVFRGEHTLFPAGRALNYSRITDGSSNTLLVVHAGGGMRAPWTKPDDIAFDEAAPLAKLGFVNGRLEGALVNAELISLPYDIPPAIVAGLVTPQGDELIDGPGLARRYASVARATGPSTPIPRTDIGPPSPQAAMSRMKQVALGMLNLEDSRKQFPASIGFRRVDDPAELGVSCRVMLLPYIEQQNLYRRYKFDESWDGDANRSLLSFMPADYRHETTVDDTATRMQVLVGVGTPFGPQPRSRNPDARRGFQQKALVDGSSKTIMAIESGRDRAVPWMQPRDLDFDPANPVASLGDLDATGTIAAMFDGSVRTIGRNIDPQVLAHLALYRDEYEAANPDQALNWASATPAASAPADAVSQAPPESAGSSTVSAPVAAVVPADDVPDPRVAEFPVTRPAFHYAYDQLTGHLLAVEYENNQATLFNLEGRLNELAVTPCPARPTAALAKRFKESSFFIVGGKLDKRIDVFDAKDGRRTGSIYIQTPGVYELAASQRDDDPYVYYCSGRGSQSGFYVGRIDVGRLVDEGELTEGGGVTLSTDGSLIYLRSEPNQSGSFRVGRIVEGGRSGWRNPVKLMCPASIEDIASSPPVTSAMMVAGPGNAFFALANVLTSATASGSLGEFDFPVFAFFPDKPWAVGLQERRLYVGSVNDKRLTAVLNLPASFDTEAILKRWAEAPVKNEFTRPNRLNSLFIDPVRGRIVVTAESSVAVAAIDSLALPDEPLVATACTSYSEAPAEQEISIPVRAFDPRIAVRLAAGPPDAKLADGMLRWTPRSRDIGTVTMLIESRREPVRFEQRLQIAVIRPQIATPMTADHVALSPDGKLAIVWGPDRDAQPSSGSELVERKLALIDVPSGKIRATCEIAKGIWQARVDANGVYILTKPGSNEGQNIIAEVMQLRLGDLKLAASGGSVETSREQYSPVFEPIAGKLLLAGPDRFRLPKLERRESKLLTDNGISGNSSFAQNSVRQTNEGWQFGNAVWDDELKRPKMLFNIPSFVGGYGWSRPEDFPIGWGRSQQGSAIMVAAGKQLFDASRLSGMSMSVSAKIPAALVLASEESAENVPRIVVQVYDLASGSRTQSLVLAPRQSRDSVWSNFLRDNLLATAGDTIAACAEGSLYFLSLDEIDRKAIKPPFRVRMQQSTLLLDDDQAIDVAYELVDGEPPYEVKLSINGFESHVTTDGVAHFRLNGAKMRENVFGNIRSLSWPPLKEQSAEPRTRVVDYLDAVEPDFKELFGRSPRGVPVLVTVALEAADQGLQPVTLNHCFVIELQQARVARALSDTQQDNQGRPYSPQSPFTPEPQRVADERTGQAKRKERLATLDAELATAYSNDLRQVHPTAPIDEAALARQARKGVQAANALLTSALADKNIAAARQPRTWSDKNGHSTVAALNSVFADQVILVQTNGAQVTVPIEKLSDSDQQFLATSQQTDAITPARLAVAQMQVLAQAIDRHLRRTGGYPPAYICDAKGKALLSWRVAILPDLGATDLFNLFHFDEPWNSPHNRKLGTSMPLVFQPARGAVRKYSTNMLAFRDDGALLADSRSLSPRDLADGTESIVVLGEAKSSYAVPWTQPVDVPATDFNRLDTLLTRHGGFFIVGTADGQAKALARETADEAWAAAIGRADGQLPLAPLMDPTAAPLDDTESDVSVRALEGEMAPTKEDDAQKAGESKGSALPVKDGVRSVSLSESAKVGEVVARATGAPAGYRYKILDGKESFAINPRTGVITVERTEFIDSDLIPSMLIKVVAVNDRGDEVPVTIVNADPGK